MSPDDDASDPEAASFGRCTTTTALPLLPFLFFPLQFFPFYFSCPPTCSYTPIPVLCQYLRCIAAYFFSPSPSSRSISFRRDGACSRAITAGERGLRERRVGRREELFSLCFRPDPSCLDKRSRYSRREEERPDGVLGLTCLGSATGPAGGPLSRRQGETLTARTPASLYTSAGRAIRRFCLSLRLIS